MPPGQWVLHVGYSDSQWLPNIRGNAVTPARIQLLPNENEYTIMPYALQKHWLAIYLPRHDDEHKSNARTVIIIKSITVMQPHSSPVQQPIVPNHLVLNIQGCSSVIINYRWIWNYLCIWTYLLVRLSFELNLTCWWCCHYCFSQKLWCCNLLITLFPPSSNFLSLDTWYVLLDTWLMLLGTSKGIIHKYVYINDVCMGSFEAIWLVEIGYYDSLHRLNW